jgi:hypothetical protein
VYLGRVLELLVQAHQQQQPQQLPAHQQLLHAPLLRLHSRCIQV